jgi:VIT family
VPYVFSSGWPALIAAIVVASLALFTVGAVIGVLNCRGGLRSGMRQLLIGGGAALLVYVIGRGVGTFTGIQLGGAQSRAPTVTDVAAQRVTVSSRRRCRPTPPAPPSRRSGRPAPWWRRSRR